MVWDFNGGNGRMFSQGGQNEFSKRALGHLGA